MIATNRAAMFAITFTVGYAVIYAICTEFNLPLLTYHPVTGEVDFLSKPPRSGPAMYWYGWLLTALIGATILTLVSTVTPERWMQRGITFGVLAAVGYLIVYSVALFIYDKATIELEFLKSRWLSAITAIVVAAAVALFYAQLLERARLARLGLGRPHWGDGGPGLLSDAVFHAVKCASVRVPSTVMLERRME